MWQQNSAVGVAASACPHLFDIVQRYVYLFKFKMERKTTQTQRKILFKLCPALTEISSKTYKKIHLTFIAFGEIWRLGNGDLYVIWNVSHSIWKQNIISHKDILQLLHECQKSGAEISIRQYVYVCTYIHTYIYIFLNIHILYLSSSMI